MKTQNYNMFSRRPKPWESEAFGSWITALDSATVYNISPTKAPGNIFHPGGGPETEFLLRSAATTAKFTPNRPQFNTLSQ
ncbi:hypothetical protein [[Phormidium] sp. ETS-05]|uniref:hypothetical protein n=1 Tax=[Phormidium] sp. ETS-05 TaxID=222819 RepID=UPI0018EF340B|nr:hypothetical protein [[Phormidium] sp. ETS-05]